MPDCRYRDGSDHHKKECRIPVVDDIEKSSDSIRRGHIRECESKAEKHTRDERDEIDSSGHSILDKKMSNKNSDHTTRDKDESGHDRTDRKTTDTADSVPARAPIGHAGTHSYEYPCDDGDEV